MRIPQVNFEYKILFVDGTLKGLTSIQNLKYPLSSMERETRRFEKDIATGRIMGSTKSKYRIVEVMSITNLGDV